MAIRPPSTTCPPARAGGVNACPYGLSGYLPGSTLAIDGKPLVKAGTLKAVKI